LLRAYRCGLAQPRKFVLVVIEMGYPAAGNPSEFLRRVKVHGISGTALHGSLHF
jgi:hypothetical protein